MNELELEFNIDTSQIGFRLQYMELLNWGTFHDKIWRIEPDGNNSLLTGSIGAGKSTIVDALTCLLVPHHKIVFNKATNPESKERSIPSYIKGEYKRERDDASIKGKAITHRYKTESDATFTVILANFSNKGYERSITLAVVFWLQNNETRKLLVISQRPLTIKEHFTNFQEITELKRKLKSFDYIKLFDENFSHYSQEFRHQFGMNSEKAIDLFYQTVSMKSVSSLTSFVREQMLERTDIKTQIEELKKRFDDLNKSYIAVQEARKQRDILKPLVELSINYSEFEKRIQEIDNIIQSIPSYFASKKIDLLEEEIKLCEGKLNQLTNQLTGIEEELKTKRKSENQINQAIDNNGGARLREIANEIEQREKLRDSKKEKHSQYLELTSACELQTVNTEQTFYRNLKTAEQKILDLHNTQEDKLEKQAIKIADQRTLQEKIDIEAAELESLKGRVNQIPLEILNIREQLANDLEIDEEEIPFAGELLKVNDDEKDWEGALERLLRGFGISMLVPEKHYRQISQYVNSRKLTDNKNRGMRFEYFKVPHNFKLNNYQNDIDSDSVVNKIDIKPDTPFEEWLQAELQKRFNLRCVSLEELQRQSDVITKEGQFKTGSQRHTKDDRKDLWDRRNFVLGWTNKGKIIAVEKHLNELRNEKREVDEALTFLKTEISKNTTLQSKLNQVISYKKWNAINWQDEAKRIAELEQERTDLVSSNDILKTLQEQLAGVLAEIETLKTNETNKREEVGSLKDKISEYKEQKENCITIKNSLLQNEIDKYFPKIEEEMKDAKLTVKNVDKARENFINSKNTQRIEEAKKQESTGGKIIRQMKEFKNQFPSESMELSDELESRTEYLKKFEKIITDGLPTHEERFKQMLKETTINDIVAFDNKLESHEKSIKKKIGDINGHLKKVEFNKGTYIEILADRNSDNEIRVFKQELKDCYSNILGKEDAYTEVRFNQVKKLLDRFNSNETKEIEWTNKVTDVRNRFIFNASERYVDTDEEKEFYPGTSGKSGGQKEKMAYTILASALAYQFGLEHGEPKSKSFRFVVIDEAFGRGDDESTQFGLGLFKKMNLQLLIVTPLTKIHIIENYINAVHYVANDLQSNFSEIQNLTVQEYKEEKYLHNSIINGIQVTETN